VNIMVNGKETNVSENPTVTELLAELKVKMPDMVTVEVNGTILDRKTFADTRIQSGDHMEFLYFMGGGRGQTDCRPQTADCRPRTTDHGMGDV